MILPSKIGGRSDTDFFQPNHMNRLERKFEWIE